MTKANEESLMLDIIPIREHLERNPYAVVAGAFGIGFILGGGLFTRVTARIVNAALRVAVTAALPSLGGELLAAATRILDDDEESPEPVSTTST